MVVLDNVYRCSVGEGPVWDVENKRLLYLDILGKCIFSYDYITKKIKKIDMGQLVGCMGLCENGDLLIALQDGIYRMKPTGEKELAHQPIKIKGERFNDGKIGPDGCFYIGTADSNGEGAFYRLKDGVLEELFDGCKCSNGLDWTIDGTKMFYCDTPRGKIEIFDFDIKSHGLKNRRDFVEIPSELGCPDGFSMDSEDNIWLGLWDGNAVLKIKSNGSFSERIEVPAKKASCCCFGGDDLTDLIITTAAKNDVTEYPLAGYVFVHKVDVKGKPCFKYKY